jgi:hypothetical protein
VIYTLNVIPETSYLFLAASLIPRMLVSPVALRIVPMVA